MNTNQKDETLAENINPDLPEDIIFNIFSRLSIKNLAKFRCLSKEFSKLHNNPHFQVCRAATLKYTTPTGFFFQNKKNGIRYKSANRNSSDTDRFNNSLRINADDDIVNNGDFLINADDDIVNGDFLINALDEEEDDEDDNDVPDPFLNFLKQNDNDIVDVLDSCSGLLLCTFAVKFSESRKSLYVCNPLTKEKVRIPFPDNRKKFDMDNDNCALFAEWNPSGCFLYKVICIHARERVSRSRINSWIFIFSSQTAAWERIDHELPALSDEIMKKSKVIFNGALFWDCFDNHILVVLGKENKKRCFELIEAPKSTYGRSIWDHNGKLLCYCHGWNIEDDSRVRQLSFNKNNKFEWTIYNSKEFVSLEEDLWNEYASFRGNKYESFRAYDLPKFGRGVDFSIMAYSPKLKTLWLHSARTIFRFEMSERTLGYHCGSSPYIFGLSVKKTEFRSMNCVFLYVHSFSAIQARPEKVLVELPSFKYLWNCQRGRRKKKGQYDPETESSNSVD
ncbi:hypothetical protein ACHQM5_027353 [Ranunculus cassubicifolius]